MMEDVSTGNPDNALLKKVKKAISIDGEEYGAGELSERDLFKIYFKKNMALWAERYEDEFFNDKPETNIDIESEEEIGAEEVENITPQDEFSSEEESDLESLL